MAIGNRYQLIDFQEYLGQDCLNVFYYRQLAGTHTNAAELAVPYIDTILPAILPVQTTLVTHVAIGCKNLDVPTDFTFLPLTEDNVGSQDVEGLPPFAAWSFRYNRTQTDFHNGAKRFVGVPETFQANGVATAPALASLEGLADTLEGVLGDVYYPRIMRKETDPDTGIVTYTDISIASIQYVRIGTQNTRKFGRGA